MEVAAMVEGFMAEASMVAAVSMAVARRFTAAA